MNRPLGLTIIGWLAVVGGALQVIGSLGLVGIGSLGLLIGPAGRLAGTILLGWDFPIWTGIVLIVFGAIGLLFGYGVLALRPWSWVMGIVLYILNLLAAIALIYATGWGVTAVFTAVLSIVILVYLFSPTVRAALGHPSGGEMGTQTPSAA